MSVPTKTEKEVDAIIVYFVQRFADLFHETDGTSRTLLAADLLRDFVSRIIEPGKDMLPRSVIAGLLRAGRLDWRHGPPRVDGLFVCHVIHDAENFDVRHDVVSRHSGCLWADDRSQIEPADVLRHLPIPEDTT